MVKKGCRANVRDISDPRRSMITEKIIFRRSSPIFTSVS